MANTCYILLQNGGKIIKQSGDGFLLLTNCVVDEEPRGGGFYNERDLQNYRKTLKQIADAADSRLFKKLVEKIEVAQESAPTVEIAQAVREITVEIDFAALANAESNTMHQQLVAMLARLDLLVKDLIMREEEDELIILMAAL